jgi:hypothetical protein
MLEIDATAFDEYDGRTVEPEFIFSEGAVDDDGFLLEGQHSCIVRYTDDAGNSAEIEIALKVAPKDVTAPSLSWTTDKIFANEGMRPMLTVTAEDDRDGEVEVAMTWSDGALDSRGRLTMGEHTLTLIAVDETGNKTEKVIAVSVSDNKLPNVG